MQYRQIFQQKCADFFCDAIKTEFDFEVQTSNIVKQISTPPNSDLGDFAIPCFAYAKQFKVAPQEIAAKLSESINKKLSGNQEFIISTSIASAFLNFTINRSKIANLMIGAVEDGSIFTPLDPSQSKKVMIEFSQPNTHKNFHVGHLRNVCLGDAMVRLYRFLGHDVIAANYIGDEGTHIAECLWYIEKNNLKAPEKERIQWLEDAYANTKRLRAELKDQPENLKEVVDGVNRVHNALEQQQEPYYSQWQETKEWCMEKFREIYTWLDCSFDHYFYESEMTEASQEIVEEFLKKGVFVEDDGAVGTDLKKDKLGFCILRKRSGATLYATKDLALARIKYEKYNVDQNIYVVAHEQNLHFKQVFKTLEKMGFEKAKDCYHLSYAFVRVPEGKMGTRKGNAIHFELVQKKIIEELDSYLEKHKGSWSIDKIIETKRLIALGALKYGMLSTDPQKEIVFKIEDWLNPEGETGPYLLYSLTRAKSLLRKAKDKGMTIDLAELQKHEFDSTLEEALGVLKFMYSFTDLATQAALKFHPTTLCKHLYQGCREFNRFYDKVHVLVGEPNEVLARLRFIKAYIHVMEKGLDLIGIVPVEEM